MNLVDVIKHQLAGEVGKKLSGMAGISEGDLQKTIGVALPGLLSGLGSVASTKEGAEKVANAIGGLDSSMFGNLASMVGGGALQKGGSMLGNLLGGGVVDGLAAAIGKTTGISQALIKTALGYLVPLVLGSIGSSFKGGKIDANGISKLFSEQKQNIAASVPAGLNLDSISGFKALSNAGSAAVSAASKAPAAAASGLSGLLVPGVIIAALLAAAMWYFNKGSAEVDKVTETVGTATSGAKDVIDSTKDALANSLPSVDLEKMKGDAAGLFDSLSTDLGKVTDVATAEASLPGLQDSVLKLETLSGAMKILPADGTALLGDFVKGQLEKLNPIIEKISAIPGLGDSVKSVLDKLKTVLAEMMG